MASPITLRLELAGGKCEFVVGSFLEEIELIEDSRSHSMYVLKYILWIGGRGKEWKGKGGKANAVVLVKWNLYRRKKRWGTIFSLST
jgi:hypothetical protein